MLYVLSKRKGNSVCGNRDSLICLKRKKDPKSLKTNTLASSRRSLSVYSERQAITSNGIDDVKKLEWRHRVKDRARIPDFFKSPPDNVDFRNDKSLRFSTPLPKKSDGD